MNFNTNPNMPYYANQYPQQRPVNNINWVQGIEGAKAFQLAPGSNIVLLDSESDTFYIKSCDNIGMCTLRTFTYSEELDKPKTDYVTREELEEVMQKYEQLISGHDKQTTGKSVQQSTNAASNESNKK